MRRHILALMFVSVGNEKTIKPPRAQFVAQACRTFGPKGGIGCVVSKSGTSDKYKVKVARWHPALTTNVQSYPIAFRSQGKGLAPSGRAESSGDQLEPFIVAGSPSTKLYALGNRIELASIKIWLKFLKRS